MVLFLMMTRLTGEEIQPTMLLEEKEDKVMRKIKEAELEIEWVANYVSMGAWSYLDIFRAPNMETAMQLCTLIRGFGRAHVEICPILEWRHFKEVISDLPKFYSTEQQN